ncbi:MAG: phosphatase PAP2 family protein [Oscillospiraceae bacterium]|nr:phosphatase PAP2 family protein [Oscillospiraceae bacterium]
MLNKAYRKTGLIVVFGLMAGVIFGNLLLKPLAARPRPCWNDKSIELLIPVPHDYSFPSGHTISSVTASIILSVSSKFGYISIPVAVLISFSRLYLYVHYPSDIIAGVITGILISLCILYFI